MISGRYMDEILYARKIEIKKQRKDFLINLVIGVCKLAELFLIYLLAINKYAAGGLMLVNFILYINASYQIASIYFRNRLDSQRFVYRVYLL